MPRASGLEDVVSIPEHRFPSCVGKGPSREKAGTSRKIETETLPGFGGSCKRRPALTYCFQISKKESSSGFAPTVISRSVDS